MNDSFRNKNISKNISESTVLLHSRYSMSKDEGRIIIMCMEKMRREGGFSDTGEYWFSVSDYCDVFNISRNEALNDIKFAIDKLSNRWIHVKNGDKEESMRWIGKKMRDKPKGTFGVVFYHELLPYINSLSNKLTIPLYWMAKMNNDISQRFLKWVNESILKDETSFYISLEDLRVKLDILDIESYKLYGSLKRRVINPSIENINDVTNLNISYTEVKKGRKVEGILISYLNPKLIT